MRNLVYESTPDCLVVVRGRETPTDEEWRGYLRLIERTIAETVPARALVITLGGSPTPQQRMQLNDVLAPVEATVRVAVLTASTYARGVVSVLSAENPGYRVFSPAEMDAALTYLGVRPSLTPALLEVVDRLRAQVG
jgi:hypothetical protein